MKLLNQRLKHIYILEASKLPEIIILQAASCRLHSNVESQATKLKQMSPKECLHLECLDWYTAVRSFNINGLYHMGGKILGKGLHLGKHLEL